METFWSAMQFVEANRHTAERLEAQAEAAAGSTAFRHLLSDIAMQRRQIAKQVAAMALDNDLDVEIPPLRYEPPRTWLGLRCDHRRLMKAEPCSERAAQLQQIAQNCACPNLRRQWLSLAEQWRRLAEEAAVGRRPPPSAQLSERIVSDF